jgi:hypothetical protein
MATKSYIQELVVMSKSYNDFVNKVNATNNKEGYKDIDMLRLWNRRAEFKRGLEKIRKAQLEEIRPKGKITEPAGKDVYRGDTLPDVGVVLGQIRDIQQSHLIEMKSMVKEIQTLNELIRGLRRIPGTA